MARQGGAFWVAFHRNLAFGCAVGRRRSLSAGGRHTLFSLSSEPSSRSSLVRLSLPPSLSDSQYIHALLLLWRRRGGAAASRFFETTIKNRREGPRPTRARRHRGAAQEHGAARGAADVAIRDAQLRALSICHLMLRTIPWFLLCRRNSIACARPPPCTGT